jgi:hypothetical protein
MFNLPLKALHIDCQRAHLSPTSTSSSPISFPISVTFSVLMQGHCHGLANPECSQSKAHTRHHSYMILPFHSMLLKCRRVLLWCGTTLSTWNKNILRNSLVCCPYVWVICLEGGHCTLIWLVKVRLNLMEGRQSWPLSHWHSNHSNMEGDQGHYLNFRPLLNHLVLSFPIVIYERRKSEAHINQVIPLLEFTDWYCILSLLCMMLEMVMCKLYFLWHCLEIIRFIDMVDETPCLLPQ